MARLNVCFLALKEWSDKLKTCMWCYEHVITSTEVVKYLGVYIDRYLNCENIVSNIVSKVKVRLFI